MGKVDDLSLTGMRIVESPSLVVSKTVKRTWQERLFSWPWRPWLATRVEQAPDPSMYQLGNGTLVGHPVTVEELKYAVRDLEADSDG